MTASDHNPNARVGRYFLWLAAIGLLVMLTILFNALTTDGGIVATGTENGNAMVVLQRDDSGHYLSLGKINGQTVNFLVDTGATDVAVPAGLARKLGLEFGPATVVMTAGGLVEAWRTRLDSVSIGAVTRDNVRATITAGPLNEVLLGMSFLQYFSLSQQGDKLIISKAEQG
jgi:aspartyl protease family protein